MNKNKFLVLSFIFQIMFLSNFTFAKGGVIDGGFFFKGMTCESTYNNLPMNITYSFNPVYNLNTISKVMATVHGSSANSTLEFKFISIVNLDEKFFREFKFPLSRENSPEEQLGEFFFFDGAWKLFLNEVGYLNLSNCRNE